METTLYSLLVGIVSSIFATAILVAAAELTRRVLLPWFADRIYRGARVDGQWHLNSVEGNCTKGFAVSMNFQLKQHGDLVSGTYSHRSEEGEVTFYQLSGQIRDRYLAAKVVPKSNQHVDMGAFLLCVGTANGKLTLSGYLLLATTPLDVAPFGPLVFCLQ